MVVRFLTGLGAVVLSFFIYLGELVVLAAETMRSAVTHRMRWRLFLRQMVDIGLLSQLVVVITGGFTGAVFAAQTYFQFNKLGVASGVGAVVSAALFRELGPGPDRADGDRPRRRGDVGRDRDDEGDRTDRCPARARRSSGRLPGRAADAGDDDFDAVAGRGVHLLRADRGLFCFGQSARYPRALLRGEHGALDPDARHHHGPDEGLLLRAS